MTKSVVPFSRADYAKRRTKHTAEERMLRRYLFQVFRRKVSWRTIKFYVWYGSQGQTGLSRQNPIIID